jgi:hypothetical protein
MQTRLTVAVYRELAAARAVMDALRGAGLAERNIQLMTRPAADPATGDREAYRRLVDLGVPKHEAQLLADLVVGGTVLLAVRTSAEGEDLGLALAILRASPTDEPLATFDVPVSA